MMKFKIGATIPTVQYGNLMPEIEVEADTYEEAYALVMPKIEAIWNEYAEDGKQLKISERKKLEAFVGGEIYFDEKNHVYTNDKGEIYLSGSQYAKQFEKPFDVDNISQAMAKKFDVPVEDLVAMWKLKSEVSTTFGTALHKALELYGRYDGLAKAIDRTTNLHDHPIIKKAVEGFYEGREKEKAEYEVLVVDHANKRAGQIDRLLITGDKKCRVQDFKTNATIEKNLEVYSHQLKFYSEILEAGGWTVEGREIFHWNGEWKTYENV